MWFCFLSVKSVGGSRHITVYSTFNLLLNIASLPLGQLGSLANYFHSNGMVLYGIHAGYIIHHQVLSRVSTVTCHAFSIHAVGLSIIVDACSYICLWVVPHAGLLQISTVGTRIVSMPPASLVAQLITVTSVHLFLCYRMDLIQRIITILLASDKFLMRFLHLTCEVSHSHSFCRYHLMPKHIHFVSSFDEGRVVRG